jgi:hypothetical protein
MLAATVWDVIAEHAGSFLFGVLVGMVVSSRYRIVRLGSTATDDGDAPPP